MDIGTHAATGFLLSLSIESPAASIACIIGSVAPDIAMIPGYVHLFKHHKKFTEAAAIFANFNFPLPKQVIVFYRLTHSLLPVLLIAVCGFFVWQQVIMAWCIGHISHILWDIPTHTGQFACRPIYPLSEQKLEGFGDWWQTKFGVVAVVISWFILGGSLLYVFL